MLMKYSRFRGPKAKIDIWL